MNHWRIGSLVMLVPFFVLSFPLSLLADTADQDVKELQAEIQNKKSEIETIGRKLGEYRSRIAEYSQKVDSLASDVALLENEQAMAELDITATQTEIDAAQLELQLLQKQMTDTDAQLATQQVLLEDVLFAVHKQDMRGGPLEVVIGAHDFGDVFRAASQLADMNTDLQKALASTQDTRTTLQEQEADHSQKLMSLADLEQQLQDKALALDGTKNAKLVLMTQTQDSEDQYRALISELRQEQASISARIDALQESVADRLAAEDGQNTGSTTITWPLSGTITATFHDPTYPFQEWISLSDKELLLKPLHLALLPGRAKVNSTVIMS
jgi:peptidoglycan hydrolase CwlO-like protein